jgi:hypothetical protein
MNIIAIARQESEGPRENVETLLEIDASEVDH